MRGNLIYLCLRFIRTAKEILHMERRMHPKYYPTFIPAITPVDTMLGGRQESWSSYPLLNTGLVTPTYDLNGNISFSLPLESYPPINGYSYDAHLMDRYNKRYTKHNIDPQY